jgi:hypothetical protein
VDCIELVAIFPWPVKLNEPLEPILVHRKRKIGGSKNVANINTSSPFTVALLSLSLEQCADVVPTVPVLVKRKIQAM